VHIERCLPRGGASNPSTKTRHKKTVTYGAAVVNLCQQFESASIYGWPKDRHTFLLLLRNSCTIISHDIGVASRRQRHCLQVRILHMVLEARFKIVIRIRVPRYRPGTSSKCAVHDREADAAMTISETPLCISGNGGKQGLVAQKPSDVVNAI
jgi:hypothetical protein